MNIKKQADLTIDLIKNDIRYNLERMEYHKQRVFILRGRYFDLVNNNKSTNK